VLKISLMPKLLRKDIPVNSKCYSRNCDYCETPFFSTKPFAKYCSDKCRVYYGQELKLYKAGINIYGNSMAEAALNLVHTAIDAVKDGDGKKLQRVLRKIDKMIADVKSKIPLNEFPLYLAEKRRTLK
jgi:hypothetical protein